jgi:methylmalonyl-CoA mutase N-terminal domain/subunit
VVVGVNRFIDDGEPMLIPAPEFSVMEGEQVERLRAVRAARDSGAALDALARLSERAVGYELPGARPAPLMGVIIDAVRARATVGEISDALRRVWGVHRPS